LNILESSSGERRTIFESPDEGRPPGTEQFLWSADGRYLLLVGRHFRVVKGGTLADGRQLYLLYDSQSTELRCNAEQSNHTRFSAEEVARLGVAIRPE
jgi:hypothetical protein